MTIRKTNFRKSLYPIVMAGLLTSGCAQIDAVTQAAVMAECALSAETRALSYAIVNEQLRRSGRTIRVTEPYCGGEPQAQFLTRLHLMLR